MGNSEDGSDEEEDMGIQATVSTYVLSVVLVLIV